MRKPPAIVSTLLLAELAVTAAGQEPPKFRSGVAVVSIAAVVRDSQNRIVRGLSPADFQVLEHGHPRPIVGFQVSDDGPATVALLFDVSGSMRVAANLEAGQRVVDHLLEWMKPGIDEAALFTFDKRLRQDVAFTGNLDRIRDAVGRLQALGQTSLYDAVAETAKRVGSRPSPRRAVVVITDGIDTSSTLTSPEVSGLASAIDVPVYVIAVVSPLDHPGGPIAAVPDMLAATNLSNLAYWTGGDVTFVSAPAQATDAARELIADLRHQYLLAIEPAGEPGWRPLEVTTRREGDTVKARSGYMVGRVRGSN